MAEYKSRKKRWIATPNVLFIALCVFICIPSTKGVCETDFDDTSVDRWKFLIGASPKQLLYDFCKYNGTSNGEQCHSFGIKQTVDFEKVCGCHIQQNKTIEGSFSFDLDCTSNLSYCPEKLTVTYRQGPNATAPHQVPSRRGIGDDNNESPGNPPGPGTGVHPEVTTSGMIGWLAFIISNVIWIILFIFKEKVHDFLTEMWNRLSNRRREQPDLNVNQPNPTGIGRNVIESFRIPQRFNLGQSGLETGEHSDSDSSDSDLLNTLKKLSRNIEVDKTTKTKFKDRSLLLAGAKPLAFTDVQVNAQDDSCKRTALHYLAAKDEPDPDKIQTLLENGADVNARNQEGLTALHLAAWRNKNDEIVKILLEKGAIVNARDNDKWTALHLAARFNPASEIVQKLLENGADVNSQNIGGCTALHLAAWRNKNAEIVKILVENGAKVNARNNDSVSALHFAARFNPASEIVQMLLENGADIHSQTEDGSTALHLAAGGNGNPEIVKILVENGAKVNAQDIYKRTALHCAAENKKITKEVFQQLIKYGADVDTQDQQGWTALNMAANSNKNAEKVKILLERGSIVNAQDNDKCTALHLAARYNPASEIVQMLLEYGADIDLKTQDGSTALHLAAGWNENPELVKILVGNGAKVNAQDDDKRTALHYAAKNKEITEEVFQQLIEYGADVDTQDNQGLTPLDLARSNENPEIVKILLEATKMNAREGPSGPALHDATTMKKNL